ncbi:hypothetical protein Q1695_000753 [Nippostrongylus brasiliensis]|nr:hypothetical protein Q1695_000753 [Nippostrongylus brasiliensis]
MISGQNSLCAAVSLNDQMITIINVASQLGWLRDDAVGGRSGPVVVLSSTLRNERGRGRDGVDDDFAPNLMLLSRDLNCGMSRGGVKWKNSPPGSTLTLP